MEPLAIAAVVLGCSYASALIGMLLHQRLPERHLDSESRDVVKLVMGLVATMAALVLGLLVAAASASNDRQTSELRNLSADIILFDRTLAVYGPDAQALRDGVREVVRQTHDAIWSPTGARSENLNSPSVQRASRAKLEQVAGLAPTTDMQRMLQGRALAQADSIAKSRLLMFESRGNQISWPFLAVLTFWLSMLFLGFGLQARFNATVAVALFVGALSVAGAIFMILELNEPYRGLLRISDAPLTAAIAQLGR